MGNNGNPVGQFAKYAMFGLGAFAIIDPRRGFYTLLLLTAYLDGAKRFLILGDRTSYLDLYWVLGIAPAVMLGLCVGVTLSLITGKRPWRKEYLWLYVASFLGFGVLGGAALLSSGGGVSQDGIAGVVNAGAYVPMLFVVPILFPTGRELKKMLWTAMLIFVPPGLYMIWQGIFGLSDLEYDYLLSGLTQESRILYEQEVLRPFSTLNGASTASVIFSVFAVMALVLSGQRIQINRSRRFFGVLISLLFLVGAWFTVSRTGWACGVAAAMAAVLYRTRTTTFGLYASGVALALGLILASDYLLETKAMGKLQSEMSGDTRGDARTERAITMGTMDGRFESFSFLKNNKDIWTPFGVAAAGKQDPREYFRIHDAITDYLVRIGYIPLGLLMIIITVSLFVIHRRLLRLQDDQVRALAILAMACAFGIGSGALVSPSQLRVYPMNVYFFCFIGVVLSGLVHKVRDWPQVDDREDTEPEGEMMARPRLVNAVN